MLYLARKRSGLTLREIGVCAGELDYKAIGKAVERFGRRLETDSGLKVTIKPPEEIRNKHLDLIALTKKQIDARNI